MRLGVMLSVEYFKKRTLGLNTQINAKRFKLALRTDCFIPLNLSTVIILENR